MFRRHSVLLLGAMSVLLLVGLVGISIRRAPTARAACSQGCANNPCPPGLTENDPNNNSSWVEVLQFSLNAFEETQVSFSFSTWPLTIDGKFGPATKTAVVAWQSYAGILSGAGAVGDRTWQSLDLCPGSFSDGLTRYEGYQKITGNTCPPAQSKGSSTNSAVLVQAIQDMMNQQYANNLIDASYPNTWSPYLASDGSFGSQTLLAVENYQFRDNIPGGGGAVGNRTWKSLAMCY